MTDQDLTANLGAIDRITTSGTTTLTLAPTADGGPSDITAGSNGNLWFTELVANVRRITTS